MTDNEEWEFDLDDLDNSSQNRETPDIGSDVVNRATQGVRLLPFSVTGVFAFVEQAAFTATLSSFLGSGLTAALTTAFWAIGALTVAGIAVTGVLVLAAMVVAGLKGSRVAGAIGMLGLVYYGVSALLAVMVFGSLPFLVGFIIASTVVIYVGMLVAYFIGGTVIIALL